MVSDFSLSSSILEDIIKDGNAKEVLSNKRIGFFPGSFNYAHKGHEAIVDITIAKNLCDYGHITLSIATLEEYINV